MSSIMEDDHHIDGKPPPKDNPCWGGNERHEQDLMSLLFRIGSGEFSCNPDDQDSTIILHDCDKYLVLNKPPDLRMDGPQPATVHKLVTYYYPPPSLLLGIGTRDKKSLIQRIEKLDTHASLADNIIRPTHQLDYATSGVLLMAKSKAAAAVACRAFEDRSTKKEYLAIVRNHINANDIPILTDEQESIFHEWLDGTVERRYRKSRRDATNRKGKTFPGYMPAHSVFGKWKGVRLRKRKWKEESEESFHEQAESMKHLLMQPITSIETEEEKKILNMTWKDIKSIPKYMDAFTDLTKQYNEASLIIHSQALESNEIGGIDPTTSMGTIKLPIRFRLRGESQDAYYIQAPLVESSNMFRVFVKDDHLVDVPSPIKNDFSAERHGKGGVISDARPSLTRCVVLLNGTWGDIKATKVLLQPRTGRRHQLRVHMAITGHPILGDVAYADTSAFHRMCLHAHKLTIPLTEGKPKCFIAPDPFVGIIED
jgi:23S rRNA-/tRNA-specific pseudouridylate synthase